MEQFFSLLSTVIDPGAVSGAGDVATGAGDAAGAVADTGIFAQLSSNPVTVILIYCVVIFGAMYFFSIKPQKKREKQLSEMRSQIKPGDWVVLNTGMYGKVADETVECFIIEFGTNKGVLIPVMKQEVYGRREPNLTNKAEEVVETEKEKKSLFAKKKEEKAE